MSSQVLIGIDSVRSPDSEAFVGRVLVGDIEVYRTVSAYSTSDEATHATAYLLAGLLGPRLAGQEWHSMNTEVHHAPLRTELQASTPQQPTERTSSM